MKHEKGNTVGERFALRNCRYLMQGLRRTHTEGSYPFFYWINLELELLNSGPSKVTSSMINKIDLSGGLVTFNFIYLSVEEVVMISIYIILWIFFKCFGMFQEEFLVHVHCFYPVNQRSYFQCLSTALPFSLKPMISASSIGSITAFVSVFSLVVRVSAFPWIPVTGQQSTFQASYFWISQKSSVISEAARCHKSSMGARNHCTVQK